MSKLVKKLDNGKYAVNKRAVIAKLLKAAKARKTSAEGEIIPVSQEEINQEALELRRYTADALLNQNEE